MSNFEDHLWQALMTERGDTLARMSREASRPAHRRARLRLSAVAALAVAVAAVAVALASVRDGAPALGTIKNASFTLHKNPNGTATLTINPKELLEPGALQSDLAQYGIPAKVTVGSFCSSNPAPAGFLRVWSDQSAGQSATPTPVANPTATIDPSAMPSGTELSIGDFRLANGDQQANAALINASSYSCTNTPPPNAASGGGEVLSMAAAP